MGRGTGAVALEMVVGMAEVAVVALEMVVMMVEVAVVIAAERVVVVGLVHNGMEVGMGYGSSELEDKQRSGICRRGPQFGGRKRFSM